MGGCLSRRTRGFRKITTVPKQTRLADMLRDATVLDSANQNGMGEAVVYVAQFTVKGGCRIVENRRAGHEFLPVAEVESVFPLASHEVPDNGGMNARYEVHCEKLLPQDRVVSGRAFV